MMPAPTGSTRCRADSSPGRLDHDAWKPCRSEAPTQLPLASPDALRRPKSAPRSKWLSTPPFVTRRPLSSSLEDRTPTSVGTSAASPEPGLWCNPSVRLQSTRRSPSGLLLNASPTSPMMRPFVGLVGSDLADDGLEPLTLPRAGSQAPAGEAGGSSSSAAPGGQREAPLLRASKQTSPRNGDGSVARAPCFDITQLGQPLAILPKDIDPEELMEFRYSYQRFRAGQAAGARGEISWLAADDVEDRGSAKRSEGSGQHLQVEGTQDAYCSDGEIDVMRERASSALRPPSPKMASGSPSSPLLRRAPSPLPMMPPGGGPPALKTSGPATDANPAKSCTGASTAGMVAAATRTGASDQTSSRPKLLFSDWLFDEINGRPRAEQLKHVPRSHLVQVMQAFVVEKILGLGFLLCLDILLHELSFMPAQVFRVLAAFVRGEAPSITEQCDFLRFVLLIINVILVVMAFDVSYVYHYIRGESFLKLYVSFNMLEMFERWLRSIGVDLFELVMASLRDPWEWLLLKIFFAVVYCFAHTIMHFLRVVLFGVALNTSSSALLLIIVTNNFGEIKSTVFKRYEAKSLFPIITSDIVERFYLFLDLIFVLLRLSVSPHRGLGDELWHSLFLIVAVELATDWVKFGLVIKFSELKAKTLETYREVLMADILLCRATRLPNARKGCDVNSAPGAAFRGIQSFSHVPARRVGFCGLPLTSLVVIHLAMVVNAPCSAYAAYPRAAAAALLLSAFILFFLAKVLLSVILFGCAARRRGVIAEAKEGMDLYPKLKAL